MKLMKHKLLLFFVASAFLFSFQSCQKDLIEDDTTDDPILNIHDIKTTESFNWSTTREVTIQIGAFTNNGLPLKKVRMEVYSSNPGEGVRNENGSTIIAQGFTDENGVFSTTTNLASSLTKLYVKPRYIGLEEIAEVNITSNKASFNFGGKSSKIFNKNPKFLNPKSKAPDNKAVGYATLGTWNSSGVPNYLVQPDMIGADLLEDINASLPEYSKLPDTHPQYLADGNDANLILIDSCDVWVTFVHEGAGYKNVLGYYTYEYGSTIDDVTDIQNQTIIFPNVSYYNSGGGLYSGDKVYLGRFGPNTVIGWFIISNGYVSSNQSIGTGNWKFYSDKDLNSETNASLRQHVVMLKDEARDLFVIGFEDILRTNSGCDQDFNDAVFYATANPIEAVKSVNVPVIDSPEDNDEDGVSNVFDDYPNDPNKAINNYYPAENQFGTLAFEDLWPAKGDYDFNDLVLDYQFNMVTNSDNMIVEVRPKFVVRAIGAGYHNGFGFQMDINSALVQSVTGSNLRYNYINLSANGTEAGNTKATIIPFDNAFNVLPSPGGTYVNTVLENTFVVPDTLEMVIKFTSPQNLEAVGTPPYNPFLIVNKIRGKEVHLPGYPPTSLVDNSFFGTEDDNTNLALGNYYKSKTNLPWGMNLPSSFVYPIEKNAITTGHLKFGQWAQSSGFSYMDWYENKLGYRNTSKLYIRGN